MFNTKNVLTFNIYLNKGLFVSYKYSTNGFERISSRLFQRKLLR